MDMCVCVCVMCKRSDAVFVCLLMDVLNLWIVDLLPRRSTFPTNKQTNKQGDLFNLFHIDNRLQLVTAKHSRQHTLTQGYTTMADSLTFKMRGLAVSSSQHASSSSGGHHGLHTTSNMDRSISSMTTSSAGLPRITPVMTKYRNPDLGKHDGQTSMASSSSAGHNQDAPRAALMRLAGGAPNFDRAAAAGPSNLAKTGSPKRMLAQHPAHGLHGPAHGTAARTLASKIVPAEAKKVPINSIQPSMVKDLMSDNRIIDVAVEGGRISSAKDTARKSDLEPLDMPFKS
jgi:hypothetical protein